MVAVVIIVVSIVFVVIVVIVVVGDSAPIASVPDGSAHGSVRSGAFSALALGTLSVGAVAFPDSSGIGMESTIFTGFFALSISGFFRNAELSVTPEATDSGRFRK